jgi:hypothetical protein
VLALSLGCDRPREEPSTLAPRPELVFEKLTLRVYRKGAPQLLVRSTHVELMRSSGDLVAQNARFDFYVDALTLDAPTLNGNLDSLSFDALGGVTFGSSDPDPNSRFTATTPSAHFEGKQGARGVATGSAPIAVRGLQSGRPFSLDANAFRFDVDAQYATFDSVKSRVGAP